MCMGHSPLTPLFVPPCFSAGIGSFDSAVVSTTYCDGFTFLDRQMFVMLFTVLSLLLLIGVVKIQVHLARFHAFTKDPLSNQSQKQSYRKLSKRSFRLMICTTLFAWLALSLYAEENAAFLRYFRQADNFDGDYYYSWGGYNSYQPLRMAFNYLYLPTCPGYGGGYSYDSGSSSFSENSCKLN